MFCCWCDQFYELFPTLVTKEGSRIFSMRETVSISAFCYKVGACDFITVRNEVAKVMFLHVSVCPQGEYLGRCPPGTRYTPLGPGTSSGTRYTPLGPGTPPRTGIPPQPGTPPDQVQPPGARYTPLGPDIPPQDQVYRPRPGTLPDQVPPWDQVHPPDQVHPHRTWYTN